MSLFPALNLTNNPDTCCNCKVVLKSLKFILQKIVLFQSILNFLFSKHFYNLNDELNAKAFTVTVLKKTSSECEQWHIKMKKILFASIYKEYRLSLRYPQCLIFFPPKEAPYNWPRNVNFFHIHIMAQSTFGRGYFSNSCLKNKVNNVMKIGQNKLIFDILDTFKFKSQ